MSTDCGGSTEIVNLLRHIEKSEVWTADYLSASPSLQMCCQVYKLDVSLCVFVLWSQPDSSSATVGQVLATDAAVENLGIAQQTYPENWHWAKTHWLQSNTATLPTMEYLMILFSFCPPPSLSLTLAISHYTFTLSMPVQASFLSVHLFLMYLRMYSYSNWSVTSLPALSLTQFTSQFWKMAKRGQEVDSGSEPHQFNPKCWLCQLWPCRIRVI